ncbi:hypothetical protein QQ73_08875 [Candidatus Endoriftia persephone str. Guaymas]|nr:hypothetical protein [Candidatus Endoriftia persephone str. Guaymas]
MDDSVLRVFKETQEHDPADWLGAMALAHDTTRIPLGLLYRNPDAVVYEDLSAQGLEKTNEEKLAAIDKAIDAFSI